MILLRTVRHLFIPHESNNHRAKLLHHDSLILFLAGFLIFQFALSSFTLFKPRVLGFASQISPERVVELTNQERAKIGAPPLQINSHLSEAAQRKAGDMFAFNYWAHTSPSGRDPWSFFKETGYNFLFAGENLARDFATPESVVSAWMASPSHRENLLNPKYQEIGVAVIDGSLTGVETTLVVQLFGTPVVTTAQASPRSQLPPQATSEQQPSLSTSPGQFPAQILSKSLPQNKIFLSPFSITRNLGLILFVFLVGILTLDGIVAYRKKTLRLTGRTIAHLLFLVGAISVLIIAQQGVVL